MVLSNTVTIKVEKVVTPPNIVEGSVVLTPSSTSIQPGDTVTFYVEGRFDTVPTPEQADQYQLECKIYINKSLHSTQYFSFQEGSQVFTFSFQLTFNYEGTYDIYVDVNVCPSYTL